MAVDHIKRDDSLNDGRVKINAAIDQSNDAIAKATKAEQDASEAKTTANSVQEQFNQVVIEGDSSVEAAQARVSADGTSYTTLKERLDSEHGQLSAQMAHKANKKEVNDLATNKADKTFVDSALHYKRDKTQPIGLNDLDEETLQAIAGGESTEFIIESIPRPYSVDYEKTTFALKGKNLFDGNYEHGLIITGDNQSNVNIEERPSGYSAIVKLNKGQTYTISRSDDVDRFTMVATDDYPTAGMTGHVRLISNNNSAINRTVTLEGDEQYLMIYLSSPNQDITPTRFQVEKGENATEYEPPNYVKILLTERSIEKKHLAFDIDADDSIYVNITDFGADPNNIDNKTQIQNAIDYAASLTNVAMGIVKVFVPEGTFFVDGTLYARSRVELVGNGIIKAANNANFDYVEWGGIARPTGAKTLFAITGTEGNPIRNAGVRGVAFDFNGENQNVEPGGSYVGIAISQAEDCWAYEATSENVMYEKTEVIENEDKVRSLCLFIANAKRTKVFGGRYWKAGYDAVRIAGGAEDTSLINVFAGKAKRGAIQFTPDSNIVHLSNCTFDNREGGHSTSHAFFAHNLQNVYVDGLTLLAKEGYCIAVFSDGNVERSTQSKFASLKNVVMENEEERFISLTSLSDDYFTKNINIQGIVLTTEKTEVGSGHVPIYVNRCENITLDLEVPNISMNPISLQHVDNVSLKANITTNKAIYSAISLSGSMGAKNIKIHDTAIDAPNAQRGINSAGTSDNVRIVDTKMNTIDSVNFPASDANVTLRDCDFREVQNADKLRLVATESIVVDNVLGA